MAIKLNDILQKNNAIIQSGNIAPNQIKQFKENHKNIEKFFEMKDHKSYKLCVGKMIFYFEGAYKILQKIETSEREHSFKNRACVALTAAAHTLSALPLSAVANCKYVYNALTAQKARAEQAPIAPSTDEEQATTVHEMPPIFDQDLAKFKAEDIEKLCEFGTECHPRLFALSLASNSTNDNTEIFNALHERRVNAENCLHALQTIATQTHPLESLPGGLKIEGNPPHTDLLAFVKEYFSVYLDGTLPLDKAVEARIKLLWERTQLGQEIGAYWHQMLDVDQPSLDRAHKFVPNEELLKDSLRAQCTFDSELQRYKKADTILRLHEKLSQEINLLTIYQSDTGLDLKNLPEEDQKFIKELKKKTDAFLASEPKVDGIEEETQEIVEGIIKNSIESRKESLVQLGDFLSELNPGRANEGYLSNWREWNNSESDSMQQLLNDVKAEFAKFDKAQETDEGQPVSTLRPELNNYFVIPFEKPLQNEGKWLIVKLPSVRTEAMKNMVQDPVNLLSFLREGKHLEGKKPNHSIWLKMDQGQFVVDPKGDIEVCYETTAEVVGTQEDRDFSERTRREVETRGVYKRQNKAEMKHQQVKNLKRQVLHRDWSDSREATAGADRLESIWVSRLIADQILSGRLKDLSRNDFQNLSEYFDAVAHSDIATLEGSYAEKGDPVWLKAWTLMGNMRSMLEEHYKEGAIQSYLDKAIETNYSWSKESQRINQLIDTCESYLKWKDAITQFLGEMKKDENQELREKLSVFVKQLEGIRGPLESLVAVIPAEIVRAVNEKNKVNLQDAKSQAEEDAMLQQKLKDYPKTKDGRIDVARLKEKQKKQYETDLAIADGNKRNLALAKKQKLDAIYKEVDQDMTPEKLDELMGQFVNEIGPRLKELTPSIVLLSVAQQGDQLNERVNQILTAADKERSEKIEKVERISTVKRTAVEQIRQKTLLHDLFASTVPKAFQNKLRIHDVINNDLVPGTEPSLLWYKMLRLLEVANKEIIKSEFIVSREAKRALGDALRAE